MCVCVLIEGEERERQEWERRERESMSRDIKEEKSSCEMFLLSCGIYKKHKRNTL